MRFGVGHQSGFLWLGLFSGATVRLATGATAGSAAGATAGSAAGATAGSVAWAAGLEAITARFVGFLGGGVRLSGFGEPGRAAPSVYPPLLGDLLIILSEHLVFHPTSLFGIPCTMGIAP